MPTNTPPFPYESSYRIDLPIFAYRGPLVSAIANNQVVIVTGETGCGKTTQLPLLCLEALGPDARIAVTQPRRIAAVSLGTRVAQDLGGVAGGLVGFKTRFDNCSSTGTKVLFQTDGILVSEIGRDRFFSRYNAIVIDEAHERNLNIDLIIGHLRWLVTKRRDLNVIISSATIQPGLFSKAFNNAPVIHVSGRTYPITVVYDPPDEARPSIVDAAVNAVGRLNDMNEDGDILIFMPTERDIIAAKRKLDAMNHRAPTVTLPLFARLSRAHQQRIFRSMSQRKIVIATTIAETSITVPGIRFVIDSGLARVKQYQPNSRVTALPIERISRASADQRAGRCGRTEHGICIRLYAHDDYQLMEPFTAPEIARSNMAGVILLMLSLKLGGIERFAFLQPPPAAAVKDGWAHLRELGAIDEEGGLTPTGREMTKYPLDPHLARIIVHAACHGGLPETLIIVSALSCMDPRERPVEKTEAADAEHRKWADPISDFIWYLNAWKSYHEAWNTTGSQARMRAFCKDRFLSYTRMKEWHDVHTQLTGLVRRRPDGAGASFELVHRALLAGCIAHIALYNEETKMYKMSHGGAATVFPASMLAKKSPQWILFAEKVETSRVFLRTVSKIEPEWIGEVAPHLVRSRYSAPYFDDEAGTVRATRQQSVFGLIIGKSNVAYGRINPKEANEIFIREGLIEQRLQTRHGFLMRNMIVREEIALIEAKLRVNDLYAGDGALQAWYTKQIPAVTSVHDLNREIHAKGGDGFLTISPRDLITSEIPDQASLWPDSVGIGGESFSCTYLCDPLDPSDGVTVHLPPDAREFVTDATLSWLMRPHWQKRIEAIIETLPRDTRKPLSPPGSAAERCAQAIRPDQGDFFSSLAQTMQTQYGVKVSATQCMQAAIPPFLLVHAAWDDGRAEGKQAVARWRAALACLEKRSVDSWDFGDLPPYVILAADSFGLSLYRFPALKFDGHSIDLVLCATMEEAHRLHPAGVKALMEKALARDTAWLEKNAPCDREDRLKISALGAADALIKKAVYAVIDRFVSPPDPQCRLQKSFCDHIEKAQASLPAALRRLIGSLAQSGVVAATIAADLAAYKRRPGRNVPVVTLLTAELQAYCAMLHSANADYEYCINFPRYLKRLQIAASRAMDDPPRYKQKLGIIQPLEDLLQTKREATLRLRQECTRLIEEYKISVFAQQEVKAAPGTSEGAVKDLLSRL